MKNNNDSNRLLCGHLITHAIDPAVDGLMKEKFGMDFSTISQMTLEDWAQFGQLGIDAKWVIDNIGKIEEIQGNVITSIELWNQAVQKAIKRGIKVVEGLEKGSVDIALLMTGRNAKILEGEDRLTNAQSMHTQLRTINSAIDVAANQMVIARANAQLTKKNEEAANAPAIAAQMQEFNEFKVAPGKAAKLLLNNGLAGWEHPSMPDGISGNNSSDWPSGQQPNQPRQQRNISGSTNPDSISFNWSGNIAGKTKNFGSNVVRGAKSIGNWFGGSNRRYQ